MDALGSLSFARPWMFWLLAALPVVLVLLIWRESVRRSRANRFVSERLRGVGFPARILRPILLGCGLALAVVALAGPRYGWTVREVPRVAARLVVLLDGSTSMAAADVGTSRLSAAKAILSRVITRYEGDVGLVVFEGSAELVSPLTSDRNAVNTLVQSIGTGETAEAGSDLAVAIEQGMTAVLRGGEGPASLLIVSDGEHRGGALEDAITRAQERGLPVSGVLIGGSSGATVPVEGNRVLRDREGEIVRTTARPDALAKIAEGTGGVLFVNPFSEGEMAEISRSLSRRSAASGSGQESHVPTERYQVPLALALLAFVSSSFLHRGAE